MAPRSSSRASDQRGLAKRVGGSNIVVDWPRSLGYFGAIGAAVALDLVSMPIAVFVAAVPFLKLMNRPTAPESQRFVGHLIDGAAKPVGGDAEGTVRWAPRASSPKRSSSGRSVSSGRSRRRTRTRAPRAAA
jgi:hypothetical protein